MADLVGFHRREAKPAWWAFFDRQERSAEELAEDADCLGGCVADGEDWIGQEKGASPSVIAIPSRRRSSRRGAMSISLPGVRAPAPS